VPVWYEAPLEMNEGTPSGQGYKRLHSRGAVDRPNRATFKPLTVQRPTTVYFAVSVHYATARFSAPLTWHRIIHVVLYEHMDVSLSAELNVMTT
jgi:hypothetical protein